MRGIYIFFSKKSKEIEYLLKNNYLKKGTYRRGIGIIRCGNKEWDLRIDEYSSLNIPPLLITLSHELIHWKGHFLHDMFHSFSGDNSWWVPYSKDNPPFLLTRALDFCKLVQNQCTLTVTYMHSLFTAN